MRTFPLIGLPLAAVVALTACTTGGAAPSQSRSAVAPSAAPTAATADALDGRTFVSTGATGYTLAPGSDITLRFEPTRIGVSAGCNQMSGEYEISDGILELGMMMTTEMACEQPLMAQDQWIAAFLPGAAALLDGPTLTLTKEGVTLTLLDAEVANPDRSLEGGRWVVTGIGTADAVSTVPAGTEASLVFADGKVTVEAGCNSGSATYELGEGTIRFGPVGITMKLCDDTTMELEQAVLGVLQGEVTYAIDADTLTLSSGSNALILTAAG